MQYRILIADDDPLSVAALQSLLQSRGYVVDVARSGEEAIERVNASPEQYALVILDYQFGSRDGAQVAEVILSFHPELYILMHSGDGSRDALKSSWRAGAVGFIEKGESVEAILETVRNWCLKYEETTKMVSLGASLGDGSEIIASLNMIGRSRALVDIARKIERYRGNKENVLILGETGTGKEKVARALHKGDERLFFAVNCASFNGSSELMESDLFGYERGAFTGATKDHVGVFQAARGGTVLLDEVHTLDLRAQQKLLRVIQEKTVRPLGSTREFPVDFRLVAAAKPELEAKTQSGDFLPDLFERLNVLRIDVPPLRARPEDIEPLIAFFCQKYEQETGERRRFLTRTVRYLERYAWPRNVRELENVVRRLCVDAPGERITPEQLDARFFAPTEPSADSTGLKEKWDRLVRREIEETMASARSQREAARRLGIPESSFRRLLSRLEL